MAPIGMPEPKPFLKWAGGKRWVVVRASRTAGARLVLAKAEGPRQRSAIGEGTGGRVGFFLETDDFARDHKELGELQRLYSAFGRNTTEALVLSAQAGASLFGQPGPRRVTSTSPRSRTNSARPISPY